MADDGRATTHYVFLDDLDHLTGFIWQLHGLIDAAVDDGRFIAEAMRAEIREAWTQASDDLRALAAHLAAAAGDLRNPANPPAAGTATVASTWEYAAVGGKVAAPPPGLPGEGDLQTLWTKLRDHGLLGPSGHMKLKGWRRRLFPFARRMSAAGSAVL